MTQSEMNRCANEELTRVETRLNTTYAKLLTFVSADQTSTEKIRAAERAWITYRDAYIDAKYPAVDKQAAYGTIYLMEVALLRVDLTQEHITALLKLMQHP